MLKYNKAKMLIKIYISLGSMCDLNSLQHRESSIFWNTPRIYCNRLLVFIIRHFYFPNTNSYLKLYIHSVLDFLFGEVKEHKQDNAWRRALLQGGAQKSQGSLIPWVRLEFEDLRLWLTSCFCSDPGWIISHLHLSHLFKLSSSD